MSEERLYLMPSCPMSFAYSEYIILGNKKNYLHRHILQLIVSWVMFSSFYATIWIFRVITRKGEHAHRIWLKRYSLTSIAWAWLDHQYHFWSDLPSWYFAREYSGILSSAIVVPLFHPLGEVSWFPGVSLRCDNRHPARRLLGTVVSRSRERTALPLNSRYQYGNECLSASYV